jgi:hypothetical protein
MMSRLLLKLAVNADSVCNDDRHTGLLVALIRSEMCAGAKSPACTVPEHGNGRAQRLKEGKEHRRKLALKLEELDAEAARRGLRGELKARLPLRRTRLGA